MTQPTLNLSRGLHLPVDAVTETFGVLGVRGSGKTTTARRMVEQMTQAGQQAVVIDPLGVWWGLRSSADGTKAGLPFVVIGGEHGDLPLDESAGAEIANLVVDNHLPVVIDLSLLRKAAARRFMTAFTDTLYHWNRTALHLVVDECDLFIPQRAVKGAEALVGSMEDIVRRGRARGIGVTLISQRPAVIHKDVLSQVSVLVAHRLTGPQDRKAIDVWVEANGSDEQRREMMATLASLDTGECWVWSPHWLDVFSRVKVTRPVTFDSSATPKVGEKRITPSTFATVDLDELRDRLAASIEAAEQSDPKALRRQIAKLTKQLADRPVETAEPEVVEVVREVVPAVVVESLRTLISEVEQIGSDFVALKDRMVAAHSAMPTTLNRLEDLEPATGTPSLAATVSGRPAKSRNTPHASTKPSARPAPAETSTAADGDEVKLKAGARRLLDTMAAHYPAVLTRAQIGTLAHLKHTGGTFSTYWGTLKRAGYIEERDGEAWITDAGLARADVEPANPQTTEEILDMWRGSLKKGARNMLDELVDAYPDSLTRTELGEAVELEPSAGTFSTYLGTLRRNGLVDVDGQNVNASDTLFLGS